MPTTLAPPSSHRRVGSAPPPSSLGAAPPLRSATDGPDVVALGAVLVVDDDLHVRRVARRVLTHAGFTVIDASGGDEAIAALESASVVVACAVVDVTMPGMDGPTCAERLRRLRPGLPVLFCSGYTADGTIESPTAPSTAFLAKPYRQRELVEGVVALVRRDD